MVPFSSHQVLAKHLAKILQTVAENPSNGLGLIYGGRVIAGFGIGGISAVAPAFVSECAPKEIRGRVTGLFQIMVRTRVANLSALVEQLGLGRLRCYDLVFR